MAAGRPIIYLIAGCNGAGKTTFARQFFPHEVNCLRFYNADEIARGLSLLNPRAAAIKAGRLLLSEVRESIRRRETAVKNKDHRKNGHDDELSPLRVAHSNALPASFGSRIVGWAYL